MPDGGGAELVRADVAVIGAGPAGLAAAARAAECGLRVVVIHNGLEAGGQIWRHRKGAALPRPAREWLARFERSGAQVIAGTSVVDVHPSTKAPGFEILGERRGRSLLVRVMHVVLATGARELFVPFPQWTLPGVTGIGGVQALLKSGARFDGKRVVIAGSGPLLLPVAAALADAGAKISLVTEQAARGAVARFAAGLWRAPSMLVQAAHYRARFLATPYRMGTWVTAAHGTERLESVTVTDGRHQWRETTDILCTGYGLIPNTELARVMGCETIGRAIVVDAKQATTVRDVYAAGEVTGIGGAPLALVEGEIAGLAVAGRSSPAPLLRRRVALRRAAERMHTTFALRSELRALPSLDTIVCRCEDVSLGAVQSAHSTRQAKLYTRAGMGPCQGRMCHPGLEFLLGWAPDTVRSPVEPARVSVLSSEIADTATVSFLSPTSAGVSHR